jgi:hypothetical protein
MIGALYFIFKLLNKGMSLLLFLCNFNFKVCGFFLFFVFCFCPFWESNEANAKVKGKKRSPLAGQAKETGRA